jgi:histidyl-tRNA synthetase
LVIGAEELAAGTIGLRNLSTSEQETLTLERLAGRLAGI